MKKNILIPALIFSTVGSIAYSIKLGTVVENLEIEIVDKTDLFEKYKEEIDMKKNTQLQDLMK